MADVNDPAEGPPPSHPDIPTDVSGKTPDRKAWSSDALAELASRILKRGSLAEGVDSAFLDHPDVNTEAVEYVEDDDELKP